MTANLAFRAAAAGALRFDPALGAVGNVPRRGEETAFVEGLLKAGHRGLWLTDTAVDHYIEASRASLKWLRDLYFEGGRTFAQSGQFVESGGVPRWAWRRLVTLWLIRSALAPIKNETWTAAFREFHNLRGAIAAVRARGESAG